MVGPGGIEIYQKIRRMTYTTTTAQIQEAREMDAIDPLRSYRDLFHLPLRENGQAFIYLNGNSLGLQPKSVRKFVEAELLDWEKYGVEGHFKPVDPWVDYHELLTRSTAAVAGALPSEVVVMNTLTVNLHLLMVSFYQPTAGRYKILMESDAFPSDRYAIASQVKFHGYDPETAVVQLRPRPGEVLIRMEDLEKVLEEEGEQIALVLLGGVNYYTGQRFDIGQITRMAHAKGCRVGFDLAHAAGNIELNLHRDGPDFAAWCTYKYLNSGPGNLGACFIHERHAYNPELPRFEGWWGHNKQTRFNMRQAFDPTPGAEGWMLSNVPVLPLAAMRASLEIFDEVGMPALVEKSRKLTGYLESLLKGLENERIKIITPADPDERGCQLSIQIQNGDKSIFRSIREKGVIADWREPDVVRVAPVPLYNTFEEVCRFVGILAMAIEETK